MRHTLPAAWRAYSRFTPILLLFTIPFACFRVLTGAVEAGWREIAVGFPLFLVACFIACFTYASLAPLRRDGGGYYVSWALSGVVAIDGIMALITFFDVLIDGGNPFYKSVWPWLIGAGTGASTGFMYGWHARRL